jgi:hypothetical protein
MLQTRMNRRYSDIYSLMKVCNACVTFEFWLMRFCMDCSKERENIVKDAHCVRPCAHCQNGILINDYRSGRFHYSGPPSQLLDTLPFDFT